MQQQFQLEQTALTEAAAAVAKLQKQNDDLTQKLQDLEEKKSIEQQQAASDAHRQQVLVSDEPERFSAQHNEANILPDHCLCCSCMCDHSVQAAHACNRGTAKHGEGLCYGFPVESHCLQS